MPYQAPPKTWFDKQEAAAKDYESSGHIAAAEDLRKETSEVATRYTAGNPDAFIQVVEDLCDMLSDEEKQTIRDMFTAVQSNKLLLQALKAVLE